MKFCIHTPPYVLYKTQSNSVTFIAINALKMSKVIAPTGDPLRLKLLLMHKAAGRNKTLITA